MKLYDWIAMAAIAFMPLILFDAVRLLVSALLRRAWGDMGGWL